MILCSPIPKLYKSEKNDNEFSPNALAEISTGTGSPQISNIVGKRSQSEIIFFSRPTRSLKGNLIKSGIFISPSYRGVR